MPHTILDNALNNNKAKMKKKDQNLKIPLGRASKYCVNAGTDEYTFES